MIHELHFSREIVVDINAAVVGISRNRWISIPFNEANENNAQRVMKQKGFDVLPIENGDPVNEYFCTKMWNDYSSIMRQRITHRDIIPFQTHIRDVIRSLAIEQRLFYFLSAENNIVGLISVINLNSRQVQIYLFSLLCELETLLARFLTFKIPEEQIKNLLKAKSSKKRYKDIVNRYEQDRSQGTDAAFVEYIYLSDLLRIMEDGFWKELEISEESWNELQGIKEWRNRVAHPVQSLIRMPEAIGRLWITLDRVEEALFQLRILLKKSSEP